MQFNTEAAQELINRHVYLHLVLAFDPMLNYDKSRSQKIIEGFIEKVKLRYPDYYDDYDPSSFLIHDSLQPVFIEVLRENYQSDSLVDKDLSRSQFQARLLRYSMFRLRRKRFETDIDESVLERFFQYCEEAHSDWLNNFIPVEYHMGGYDWMDDIENKWRQFLQEESSGNCI